MWSFKFLNNNSSKAPLHPGVMLKRHFMKEKNISINELARKINVPANRICAIVNEERSITVDTALRLARLLGTTPEFWLQMQIRYDIGTYSVDKANEINQTIEPLS